ncbi:hypothetical protein NLG97_g7358 [Lecanicillium saksenae]|uniref:Uncharacterized protein n=1 Tax=Lecanicillium saksenae TaxID=468837 RepID=A0ACC1QQ97_9HYPO|nr:hypothetical protein NLG97_g7358 [Lecanicillium saksenae]
MDPEIMQKAKVWLNSRKATIPRPPTPSPSVTELCSATDEVDPDKTMPKTSPEEPVVVVEEIPDMLAHLAALCDSWRGGGEGAGNVVKFYKDWPKVVRYFEERHLPCHKFFEKEYDSCLRSEAYALPDTEEASAANKMTFVSVHRDVEPDAPPELVSGAMQISQMGALDHTSREKTIISVPKDTLPQQLAKGWEV